MSKISFSPAFPVSGNDCERAKFVDRGDMSLPLDRRDGRHFHPLVVCRLQQVNYSERRELFFFFFFFLSSHLLSFIYWSFFSLQVDVFFRLIGLLYPGPSSTIFELGNKQKGRTKASDIRVNKFMDTTSF